MAARNKPFRPRLVIRRGFWWGWTPSDVVMLGKVSELTPRSALEKYKAARPHEPQFVGAGRL